MLVAVPAASVTHELLLERRRIEANRPSQKWIEILERTAAITELPWVYRYTPARTGTGAIDHIAFREANLAAARQALAVAGVSFREVMVPGDNAVQLFVRDQDGVRIC